MSVRPLHLKRNTLHAWYVGTNCIWRHGETRVYLRCIWERACNGYGDDGGHHSCNCCRGVCRVHWVHTTHEAHMRLRTVRLRTVHVCVFVCAASCKRRSVRTRCSGATCAQVVQADVGGASTARRDHAGAGVATVRIIALLWSLVNEA